MGKTVAKNLILGLVAAAILAGAPQGARQSKPARAEAARDKLETASAGGSAGGH